MAHSILDNPEVQELSKNLSFPSIFGAPFSSLRLEASVGSDAFADMLRERLEAEGIEAWNEGGHNPDRVGHEAVGIFVNSG